MTRMNKMGGGNMLLGLMGGLFVILNVVDWIQTRRLLSYGPEAESNVIIRGIYVRFGFIGVTVYKAVLTVAVLCMIQSPWFMAGLAALYLYVVLHNRSALKEAVAED